MALGDVVSADRVHIGFFGMRNAGKSSLVNAVLGQELSVVSEVKGTTTDPVSKAMELLPLGPVVVIDTPGLDDEGALGDKRVSKARRVLNYVDIAVLAVDASVGVTDADRELAEAIEKKKIPCVWAFNKCDLVKERNPLRQNEIYVSAKTGEGIEELKNLLSTVIPAASGRRVVGDLISENDTVLLVTPIDSSAPKGRLILPQQQTIRDILDSGAIPIVCRDTELTAALSKLSEPPRLVITDSQAFGRVAKAIPDGVPLTSFSILFARYKGTLLGTVKGAFAIDTLKDGDTVLISEGCTHHRQCGDIGTVKLPAWIEQYTGKAVKFEFTSGKDFPEDLSKYSLVVHCGGCMLTEREVQYRASLAEDFGVPFTNYGIAIAHTHGILKRAIAPFPEIPDEYKR